MVATGYQTCLAALYGRRRCMRWLIVLAAFAVLISSAPMTRAQEATPSAPLDALVGSVQAIARREFIRTGTHLVGTTIFSFFVVEFDTEAHAEAAGPVAVEHLVDDPELGLENLRRTSTTTFRDATLAYTGKADFDDRPADAAILIVQDGRVLHFWIAGGPNADPL